MIYKTVGIVAAKEHSKRFPNKNIYSLGNVPLFWHSVLPLLDSIMVDDVYVVTDSVSIMDYCYKKNVKVIWRFKNANHDEEPLLDVLKYAYKTLLKSYDNIITIMANCPLHTIMDVDNAINLINSSDFLEVRSFNSDKKESGLMVFKESVILTSPSISSHLGAIQTQGYEIHTKEDIRWI